MTEQGKSVLSLLAVATLAAAYVALPTFVPDAGPGAPEQGRARPAYHGAQLLPARPHPCEGCHGRVPHRGSTPSGAFLNLHTRSLRCGVCHLAGPGLTLRRVAGGGDDFAVGATGGAGWAPVDLPGPGAALRPAGPSCPACHRRGSPVLSGEWFDPYRRHLLEDLSLLYRPGGERP